MGAAGVALCLGVGLSMWRRPAAQPLSSVQVPRVAAAPIAGVALSVPTEAALGATLDTAQNSLPPLPRVAVGPVKGLGCRGGKRRARDACDRPAAALDAFSRAVAATQECASIASRPSRVEYILRYEWSRARATLEARSLRGSPGLIPADRGHCIANVRDYFLRTAPPDIPHAAAEYRWSLHADYMKDPSKNP